MSGLGGSIFDGSGALEEIESPEQKEQKKNANYIMRRYCEYCNQPREYVCPWIELFYVANGRLDMASRFGTQWSYDQARGKVYPNASCNCNPRALLYYPMTPGSAKRLVADAIDNGLVPADQMALIQQYAAAVRAQQGR